jgi:hypothetical protein
MKLPTWVYALTVFEKEQLIYILARHIVDLEKQLKETKK